MRALGAIVAAVRHSSSGLHQQSLPGRRRAYPGAVSGVSDRTQDARSGGRLLRLRPEVTGNVFDTLLEYHYLDRPYRLIPGAGGGRARTGAAAPTVRVAYRFAPAPRRALSGRPCFALDGGGRRTRAVTAADVAFALDAHRRPRGRQPGGRHLRQARRLPRVRRRGCARCARADPGVRGAAHRRAVRPRRRHRGRARARATRELEIVLREPYPQILYWFAMPFTAPVRVGGGRRTTTAATGATSLADHPVGTGPFRLTRFESHSRVVLERNPQLVRRTLHPRVARARRRSIRAAARRPTPKRACSRPTSSAGRCPSSTASSFAAIPSRSRPS